MIETERGDLIDPYGDVRPFNAAQGAPDYFGSNADVQFFGAGPVWSDDLDAIDGSSLYQVRITFVGDPQSLLSATLDGFGLAYEAQ